MNSTIFLGVALCFGIAGFAHPALAAVPTGLEREIRDLTGEALGDKSLGSAAVIAPTLRVSRCQARMTAVAVSQRSVRIECPGVWTIHVPVRVKVVEEVAVVAGSIRPGVPIEAGQVLIQRRDISSLAGVPIKALSDVVGKVLKRGLPRGAVITQEAVAASVAIRRGEPVTIRYDIGGIRVDQAGVAVTMALEGELATVRNVVSGKQVKGLAAEPGVVVVRK